MSSFIPLLFDAEEALRTLERMARENPKSHMSSFRGADADEADYVWIHQDSIKVNGKLVRISILEDLRAIGYVERYDECAGRAPGRLVGIQTDLEIKHPGREVLTYKARPSCESYRIKIHGRSYLEWIAATGRADETVTSSQVAAPLRDAGLGIRSSTRDELGAEPQKKKLPDHAERAYGVYEYVASSWPKRKGRLTDRKAYDWYKERGPEIDGYELPGFDAWAKSVRMGRKYYGTQKNSSRRGRECPSAVSVNETEPRAKDE